MLSRYRSSWAFLGLGYRSELLAVAIDLAENRRKVLPVYEVDVRYVQAKLKL